MSHVSSISSFYISYFVLCSLRDLDYDPATIVHPLNSYLPQSALCLSPWQYAFIPIQLEGDNLTSLSLSLVRLNRSPTGPISPANLNVDNRNFVITYPSSQVQTFHQKKADITFMSHMLVPGVSGCLYPRVRR